MGRLTGLWRRPSGHEGQQSRRKDRRERKREEKEKEKTGIVKRRKEFRDDAAS
jgi:hypothetical protein